jgi:hypothetical protein
MVTVLVPRGGDCPHREAAWEWVAARYRERYSDWQLLEAPAPAGPWSKGAAVVDALERAEGEAIVVADADVWCEGIERALTAVVCGFASWAMPHYTVRRISRDGTAAVLAGADPIAQDLDQNPYQGVWGGGVVVLHRDTLAECHPDPRFTGWGQEDESWATALQCLYGKGWRGTADLTHLWHPPQERLTRGWGSAESRALKRRYREARKDPDAMRALLQEADGRPSSTEGDSP